MPIYAQGGLVDLPGYYQEGGGTPLDDTQPQAAQPQQQQTPLPRPDPRSPEEKLATSPEALAQFERDMRGFGLAFGRQSAPQPQVPLPRPRPPEAPLPGDIPPRPGPPDLATQGGLLDLPPWRAMGPRSIGAYDPRTPVPEEIARQQLPPAVSPQNLRAWDAWEAQQAQSRNVEDRRTLEQIAEDNRGWAATTFVPAPWVDNRPPPWTVTKSTPSRTPRARGGLVNFRQDGGNIEQKLAADAQQKGQLIVRALDTSSVGKQSGFQFGGIAKPILGIPGMTSAARQAHFSGPNALHAAKIPGVHLINSSVPGRVDRIPMRARSGSYVLPSDVVSGMGQGNTNAGAKMWGNLIAHSIGPMGIQNAIKQRSMPSARLRMTGTTKTFAGGGSSEYTPIITAGGECLVDPEIVCELGDGDPEKGKKILAASAMMVRDHYLKHGKALPRPVS